MCSAACAVTDIYCFPPEGQLSVKDLHIAYCLDAAVILTGHLYVTMNAGQAWPGQSCSMQSIQHCLTRMQQSIIRENLQELSQGRLTSRNASLNKRMHASTVDSITCLVHQLHNFPAREHMANVNMNQHAACFPKSTASNTVLPGMYDGHNHERQRMSRSHNEENSFQASHM